MIASDYIMKCQDDETFPCIIIGYCFSHLFTTDPTPTVAEDTTDKTMERYLYIPSTDNNNDKNDQKKKAEVMYSCPKCSSHSLTRIVDSARSQNAKRRLSLYLLLLR
jgi:hypothetical protein